MKITRLYTGRDNHSYFEDIDVYFDPKGPLGLFTEPIGAKAVFSGRSYPVTSIRGIMWCAGST
jgi:hypothetical protein